MKKILYLTTLVFTLLMFNSCLLTGVIYDAIGNDVEGNYVSALNHYVWYSEFNIGDEPESLSTYPLDQCISALEKEPTYKPAANFLTFYTSEVERHSKMEIGLEKVSAGLTVKDNKNLYVHDGTLGWYETLVAFEKRIKEANAKLAKADVKNPKTGEPLVLKLRESAVENLIAAKARCAESHYKIALLNEDRLLRKNKFKAILDYEEALGYVDNYKDSKDRLAAVKKSTIVNVYFIGSANSPANLDTTKARVIAGLNSESPTYVIGLTDAQVDKIKAKKGITTKYDRNSIESCIQMAQDLDIHTLAYIDSIKAGYNPPSTRDQSYPLNHVQLLNTNTGKYEDSSEAVANGVVNIALALANNITDDALRAAAKTTARALKKTVGTGTLTVYTKSTNVNVRGKFQYIQVAETRNGKPKIRKKRFSYSVYDTYEWGTTRGDDYALRFTSDNLRYSVRNTPNGPVKSEAEMWDEASSKFGVEFGDRYIRRLKLSFM